MQFRCPHCQQRVDIIIPEEPRDIQCPSCNSRFTLVSDETEIFAPLEGHMIDNYEILERLGEGSFGCVVKARDTELDRLVAIKIPRRDELTPKEIDSFIREAQAAAQVNNDGIVSVHEIGRLESSVYIVSDFVDGITLRDWMHQEEIEVRQAALLIEKVARSLHAAHSSGVIHRDLKPSNILLDLEHNPYITDFGLAKRTDPTEITVTVDGKVLGTPAYMSPEQARGESNQADGRSDVYSLGVILYELLTGSRPFVASKSRVVLLQVLHDDPKPPRSLKNSVPRDLDTICLKSLAKDPARRYQSALEFADDLHRFLDGRPIQARPVSALERGWKWVRRNRAVSAAAVMILLLSAVLGLTWMFPPIQEPDVLRYHVLVDTVPSNAEIRLVRLDSDKLTPAPGSTVRGGKSPAEFDLRPGTYLVVTQIEGWGFHEVYRMVPKDLSSAPGMFSHNSWAVGREGRMSWDDVSIPKNVEVRRKMSLVSGGSFTMGDYDLPAVPPHEVTLEGFFIDLGEVSCAQYLAVRGRLPRELRNLESLDMSTAVRYVSWDEAVACAEDLGKRLPIESELEFAATVGGTQKFPWGNDDALIKDWPYGPVGSVEYDQTPSGIRGLYSNVAEWTASTAVPYPDGPRLPEHLVALQGAMRIVRGGTPSIVQGKPDSASWNKGPRFRQAFDLHQSHSGLGFRCTQSQNPRLFD